MSNGSPRVETELQDFLDGRLPAERRAAFEERLERSPELRRELQNALEIREALGTGDEELSPGFYTRARARFERSARREGTGFRFRLLSWETAGAAAAAALATALFVPWLMDQGVPGNLGAAGQAKVRDAPALEEVAMPADDRDVSGAGLEQSREPAVLDEAVGGRLEGQTGSAPAAARPAEPERGQRRGGSEEKIGKALKKDAGEQDRAGRTGDWSPEPVAAAEVEAQDDLRPPLPTDPPARHASRSRAKGESHALEESKNRAADPGSAPEPEKESRDDSFQLAERENEALRATTSSAAADDLGKLSAVGSDSPLISVELPAGLVAAGELRTVEDAEEWAELLDGPHGQALSMLGTPARNRRLVLVGAREDLDCEALRIGLGGGYYRLDTKTARTGSGTASGCAFTLPRDDRPVVVIPHEGEPPRR